MRRGILAGGLWLLVAGGCAAPSESPTGPEPLGPDATAEELLMELLPSWIEPAAPPGERPVPGTGSSDSGTDDLLPGLQGEPPCSIVQAESLCGPAEPDTPFADVTECSGVDQSHGYLQDYFAAGQAFGDFDRDCWPDLFLATEQGRNSLYRNLGNGTFEESELGDPMELPSEASGSAIFADYDNDGWQDLLVLNYGTNNLFHNDGGLGFTDVTAEAGLDNDPAKGEAAAWADYDGDGYLDLYVVNWFCQPQCKEDNPGPDSSIDRLYHNEGDGTFTDVSELMGWVERTGAGYAASWFDYDNDADLDLYVINDKGGPGEVKPEGPMNRNVLWRNDGPGCGGWCFTEVAIEVGADLRLHGMGVAIGDYDNDLDLDFMVTDIGPPVLVENMGGSFVDLSVTMPMPDRGQTWGIAFLDYNKDSFIDPYVASYDYDEPNILMRNEAGVAFTEVSQESGAPGDDFSLGVSVGDWDRDGRPDIVQSDKDMSYVLYRNTGFEGDDNHWVTVHLTGGGPVNMDAIGSRVTLELDDGRTLMKEVKAGSSLGSGNELALHFGLGDAVIESLTVRWPDGLEEFVGAIPVDREWFLTRLSD